MSLGTFYILCRWIHFVSLMTLAGGSLFTALMAPARFRGYLSTRFCRLLCSSALLSLITAVLILMAQTGLMSGGRMTFSGEVWQAVLQTRFGLAWQWQLVLALTGVIALSLKGRGRQQLLLLSAAGQLVGLAFVGHAAMLDGGWGTLQRSNQAIHLLSAAFWAGGLLPVLLLMKEAGRMDTRYDAIRSLMRFSRYGHAAVIVVIFSGMLNSLLLLGWPLASFRLYSQLLLSKTLLVGLMCGVALFNRYWLVPRFRLSHANAQHAFILTTLAELLLAALVLLLVSVFATLEPA